MTSRGLPGFLRRTRRSDFEEQSDDDIEDDDRKDSSNSNSNNSQKVQTSSSTTQPLPPVSSSTSQGVTATAASATKQQDDNHNSEESDEASSSSSSATTTTTTTANPPKQQSQSSIATSLNNSAATNTSNITDDGVSALGASSATFLDSSSSNISLRGGAGAGGGANGGGLLLTSRVVTSYRDTQLSKVLNVAVVKLPELRKLGWNGIPSEHRGMVWKLLLGYLPTNQARRKQTLERKRAEYKDAMAQHYDIDDNSRTLQEQETLRQVLVDVPRTAPEIPLFRNERIKRALARLLYIWAMRHPASSYVQGINDLATPLFAVFLSDYYNGEDVLDGNVMVVISEERLEEVEADVYWCLTNILAGIQDHYTADQPGVQRMVMRLEDLVQRIDAKLCQHFESVGIQFMQFAFKWMNCLLLREFNLKCIIRLWDTYISEETAGFEDFHVYVCAAFLCQFSAQLQSMGFDDLFGFMQQVPTEDWGETEVEMLLSQAYVLSTLFGGSEAHLKAASNSRNSQQQQQQY